MAFSAPAYEPAPPALDARLYALAEAPSPARIEVDIQRLVVFGTRNTLSDTASETRGIGAARRFVRDEFERISAACGGCLEVRMQRTLVPGDRATRIPVDTEVVNVFAILRGRDPSRHVLMAGDIDSRASNPSDGETDAPGANDNASARRRARSGLVLSQAGLARHPSFSPRCPGRSKGSMAAPIWPRWPGRKAGALRRS